MRRIITAFALATFLCAGSAFAGEAPKKKGECPHAKKPQAQKKVPSREAMKAAFMKKFDKDGDGKISDEEKAAIKKAFEARKAAFMKKFDKDGDGKLSDEEKAAIKKAFEARMKGHRKGPPQAHRGHGHKGPPQAHRGHGRKGPRPQK